MDGTRKNYLEGDPPAIERQTWYKFTFKWLLARKDNYPTIYRPRQTKQ